MSDKSTRGSSLFASTQTINLPNTHRNVPFESFVELSSSPTNQSLYCSDATSCRTSYRAISTIFVLDTEKMNSSSDSLLQSLRKEFDLTRLNRIHHALWWTGRPVPARPLHRQIMLRREIVIAEQMDLHLVWSKNRIYLKPLPKALLNYEFWDTIVCLDADLFADACGFLLSYIWLIRYESDLSLAKEKGLVPKDIEWDSWSSFVDSTLSYIDPNTLEGINKRYAYGELRLNRLDQIYRFSPQLRLKYLLQGYGPGHKTYSDFFKESFGWTILLLAFISTLLSSFQVGLATKSLEATAAFQDVSKAIAVLFITIPIFVAFLVGFVYISLFASNFIVTIRYLVAKQRKRRSWMQEKKVMIEIEKRIHV